MPSSEQHSRRIRAYFDSHADDWERTYETVERANDLILAERLRLALELTDDLPASSRVLDAGCGTGPLTVELVARGHRVDAVDIAPLMLERCRRNLERAHAPDDTYRLHSGEIGDLELGEGTFDAVFALGFLQYQADEDRALAHLAALLAPGGRLVVSGPIGRRLGNLFGLWDGVRRLRRRVAKHRSAGGASAPDELTELLKISTHSYSLSRMRCLLERHGLDVVSQHPHGFANFALVGPLLGTRGEVAAHRLLSGLSRWLPIGRFANDLVSLALKPGERRQ